eukprot:scaffold21589_cov155-Amphora_coffeaeformis.AAC.2
MSSIFIPLHFFFISLLRPDDIALPEAGVSREEMLGAESQNMFDFYDNPNDGGDGDGAIDGEDSDASVRDRRQFVLPPRSIQFAGDEPTEAEREASTGLGRPLGGVGIRVSSQAGDDPAESERDRFPRRRREAVITPLAAAPSSADFEEPAASESTGEAERRRWLESAERALRRWSEAHNVADISVIRPPRPPSESGEPLSPQPSPAKVQSSVDAKLPANPSSHGQSSSENDGWDDETVVDGGQSPVAEVEKREPLGTGVTMAHGQIKDTPALDPSSRVPTFGQGEESTFSKKAETVNPNGSKAVEMILPAISTTLTSETATATTRGGKINGTKYKPQKKPTSPGEQSPSEVASLVHQEESKPVQPTVSPRQRSESGAGVASPPPAAAQDNLLIGGLKLPAGAVIKKKKKRKS